MLPESDSDVFVGGASIEHVLRCILHVAVDTCWIKDFLDFEKMILEGRVSGGKLVDDGCESNGEGGWFGVGMHRFEVCFDN